jgi:hypothetical protein
MCTRRAALAVCSLLLIAGPILIGCTPNEAYRTARPASCTTPDCTNAPDTFIERQDGYDLAYVEFTERGNVFDRGRMKQVLEHVAAQARYDPDNPEQGVFTIVFVHGWKHNARTDDGNVQSFRKLLRQVHDIANQNPMGSPRKVIGVYVGWRGLSVDLNPFTQATYWERKATAEQVAKGGVTELLLRLEREVVDDQRPNRNLYLVAGHSFGGAVVLSALNEIFLERVAAATAKKPDETCVRSRPFGHGVVLLNPAIEANEVFQLKELVAETCFVASQPRLMHVISSDADLATNKAFRIGQWLGVNLSWRQAPLSRGFNGADVQFQETELDTITVGNFIPFQTGQLDWDSTESGWRYRSCVGDELECIDAAHAAQHIPAKPNEPLAFIQTDRAFIADHNDVFNDHVSAYLAAIVAENRYKRMLDDESVSDRRLPQECQSGDFGPCFKRYQNEFKTVNGQL